MTYGNEPFEMRDRESVLELALYYKKPVTIVAKGDSMKPQIKDGDRIEVRQTLDYKIGDILIFRYRATLLVHRLVKLDWQYYCKGDNAFRIEVIPENAILGKVTCINGTEPVAWAAWMNELSLEVNRIFLLSDNDYEKTMNCSPFLFYRYTVLGFIESPIVLATNQWDSVLEEMNQLNNDEKWLLEVLYAPRELNELYIVAGDGIQEHSSSRNRINTLLTKLICNNFVLVRDQDK